MNKLARQLIKLGHTNPELRRHLTPILDKISSRGSYEDKERFWDTIEDEYGRNLLQLAHKVKRAKIKTEGLNILSTFRRLGACYDTVELVESLPKCYQQLVEISDLVNRRNSSELRKAIHDFQELTKGCYSRNVQGYLSVSGIRELESLCEVLQLLNDSVHRMLGQLDNLDR